MWPSKLPPLSPSWPGELALEDRVCGPAAFAVRQTRKETLRLLASEIGQILPNISVKN